MIHERPILFSGPMVRALLEGTKTQTRRIVGYRRKIDHHGGLTEYERAKLIQHGCPYGVVGDHIWVRETWATRPAWDHLKPSEVPEGYTVYYRSTEPDVAVDKWRTAIFMPRWVSRISLEICSVRVERLQEISEQDAIAEGLTALSKDRGITTKYGIPDRDGLPNNDDYGWHWKDWCEDPCDAYAALWRSIHGTDSWDANPWVWILGFRRIDAS